MQIDVIQTGDNYVLCNLYTGERCVKITMMKHDYENLIRDRFFIRDGKTPDSANIINTTQEYDLKK